MLEIRTFLLSLFISLFQAAIYQMSHFDISTFFKAADRKDRKDNKNSRRMTEDGLADDDLQVVSGEKELENLNPKERAKLEKKRGLIRAGMGAAADQAEDTGFEVAKASGAAMAMLGKRYKQKFAVDGLDVQDDREYGSDQVGYLACAHEGCINAAFYLPAVFPYVE